MKSLLNSITPPRGHGHRSGVALVIVLVMLILLSGIMIAFISSANTENVSAKVSAQGVEARQAAESAADFVIGQIREATSDGTGDVTWVSQPGAIRSVGKNASNNKVFKLYSSDVMQVLESAYKPDTNMSESGLDASGDASKPLKGYVDLNEPAFVPAAGSTSAAPIYEARYPIVSPYGKYAYSGGKFTTTSEPTTAGSGAIEGFYCSGYKDTKKDSNGATIPLLPMRVKWLYILKDGTISGTNPAGKITAATVGNPPVARTGFWVDDESCKLNINTATEGTYWDTPVVAAVQESGSMSGAGEPTSTPPASLNLSMAQPVRAEYQRFPGHPATTSLSPAIRWLFNVPGTMPYPPTNTADIEFKEAIYRLAPRVTETFSNIPSGPDSSRAGTLRAKDAAKTRKPDTDRLYASVDEYFFRPDRTGRDYGEGTSTHSDPPGSGTSKDVPIAGFTPDNLEKVRFFLTANSRTPELNVFGKPRVTTWPIHMQVKQRSAFDDLFDYCSKVGGRSFNFKRSDSNSPVVDIGSPQAKDNLSLYSYLQDMTATDIPFVGSSFSKKLGLDNRDQLLTEIFDYIRSTNLVDTEAGSHGNVAPMRTAGNAAPSQSDNTYQLAFTPFLWKSTENTGTSYGSGQVVPIRISAALNGGKGGGKDTQGFGRFVTPNEVAVLFFRVGKTGPTDPVQMQAVILIDMYTLGCGYPGLAERYSTRIRIPGVDPVPPKGASVPQIPFKVVDAAGKQTDLNFPKDAVNVVDVDAYSGPIGRMFMPSRGFENQFHYITTPTALDWNTSAKTFSKTGSFAAPNPKEYPFYSDVMTFPSGTKEFGLIGGSMTIDIYRRLPGTSEVQDKIQTITLKFPDNNSPGASPKNVLPVPGSIANTSSSDFKTRTTRGLSAGRSDLNSGGGATSGYTWIENGDTIRSMDVGGTIAKGDVRIVAAQIEIVQPDDKYTYFEPRGNGLSPKPYDNVANPRVHGLRVGRGGYMTPGATTGSAWDPNHPEQIPPSSGKYLDDGSLVKGTSATRRQDRTPQLPPGMDGVFMKNGYPGDWDRGISKNVDGPYINRADEGNVNFEPASGNLGIPYYLGFSGFSEVGPSYFSPNRMMPSAVMFGGLLTRALSDGPTGGDPAPWETLLLRPLAFANEHRGGSVTPPDHYILDLFHMPVVEPYAISEPLSTAGKVNLNYVIAPFGYVKPAGAPSGAAYIERKTSILGVLKVMKLLLVNKNATQHAHGPDDPTQTNTLFRYDLDRTKTMIEIEDRIKNKGLFRTASEICEIPLHPVGASTASPTAPSKLGDWKTFWDTYAMTGDNGRERPYAMIYPRVTAKSNVFTAYIRAQSLRMTPRTTDDFTFDDQKDQITGEYRGSTTIERFIDPNDLAIANYDPSKKDSGLDPYYRFRIVNTKRFSP